MSSQQAQEGNDARKRSLVKAISWRVVAFIILSTITYLLTGSLKETGMIAIAYNVLQIGVYFLHERVWARIKWGKPSGVDTLPHASDISPEELKIIVNRLQDLGYIEE